MFNVLKSMLGHLVLLIAAVSVTVGDFLLAVQQAYVPQPQAITPRCEWANIVLGPGIVQALLGNALGLGLLLAGFIFVALLVVIVVLSFTDKGRKAVGKAAIVFVAIMIVPIVLGFLNVLPIPCPIV